MASVKRNSKSDRVSTPPLPEGCHPLEHQVAGHIHGHGKTKAGMLQYLDGTILKAVQRPPKGLRELDFYENVFRDDQDDPQLVSLQQFLPQFLGTFTDPGKEIMYLKLEDITRRFNKPCILDVKMGQQVYEKGECQEKVELARRKYPPLEKVGFQLLGMRIYHASIDEYVFYDKTYGRSLDNDHVIEGLARYLNSDEELRTDVIPAFIRKLEEIQRWFEQQSRVHFFSSSLLLVYEGDVPESSDDESDTFIRYGSNVVSYSELEMKDSDARESKLVRESTSLPPPPPQHYNSGTNQEKTHTHNMKICQEHQINGLIDLASELRIVEATDEQNPTTNTDHGESVTLREKQSKGFTVAQMREKRKSQLGPPSLPPLANQYGPPSESSLANQYGPPSVPSLANEIGPPSVPSLANQLGPPSVPSLANQLGPPSVPPSGNQIGPPNVPSLANQHGPPSVPSLANQNGPPSVSSVAKQLGPPSVPSVAHQLGPPSVPVSSANCDLFSNDRPCDTSYPISRNDLSMQACAAEPANPITSSINEDLVEVRMIDFAHAVPGDSIDQSYLYGLKRLIQHFKTLNICGFEY